MSNTVLNGNYNFIISNRNELDGRKCKSNAYVGIYIYNREMQLGGNGNCHVTGLIDGADDLRDPRGGHRDLEEDCGYVGFRGAREL